MAISQENKKEPALHLESVSWGGLTWINIEQPTKQEIDYLAKNYPFHPLDLDDCLSRIQRPKIDEYKEYLFLVLHLPRFHKEKRVTSASQVSVFIGENYLITLHSGELKPLVNFFHQCQLDEKVRQDNFTSGSGFLLYRIIDRLIDYLFPILDKILAEVDNIEDSVFDEHVAVAEDLAVLRRDIIAQRRIIWPMRAVIGSLEPKLRRFSRVDLSVYFGDTIDHMDKIWDNLDECKEVIEVFKDTDYILSTEHVNRVLRTLTILSTIILPFLLVSSIYGMNVHLPGGLTDGSPWTFIILLGLMSLMTGSMLYFFHRKDWI
ncbi:MAG: magnesium transporter CorA family protein [Chloroflexi bacterium]|nr:magnesium transporter CorA family protein [Chloroflexota bacterium]